MQERQRILVCDEVDEAALVVLRGLGEVDVRPELDAAALRGIIGRYHALILGPHWRLDEELLTEAVNLRVIGCTHDRLSAIDFSTAQELGIEVRTLPDTSTVALAEQTLMLLLQLALRFGDGALSGKTLGLIGFGRSGREVSLRARAFNLRVLVNQPRLTPQLALDGEVETADLRELLRSSDFISLHVPYKAETAAILGADEINALPRGACLVNVGHPGLVDRAALLAALDAGRLAGAAVTQPRGAVIEHPRLLPVPALAPARGSAEHAVANLAHQIADVLRIKRPSEALSLDIVPIELVMPHEQIDDKRVARLMDSLSSEGRLANPVLVTPWAGKYVILDGATRFAAFQRLGYPHVAVQLVDPHGDYTLYTWYHAISSPQSGQALLELLAAIPGLRLQDCPADHLHAAFNDPATLCYFLDRAGRATLALAEDLDQRLTVMNAVVSAYTAWGEVERTLLTDLSRLLGQFPRMAAVAVFPQFKPEDVFNVAKHGQLLPAGLTRFVVPGRILRLNIELARLKADEPLAGKRAWLNQFLADKLARSRLRYYQEPVILLDE